MFPFKRMIKTMKNKMLFSEREDLQLNADTKITLVNYPGPQIGACERLNETKQ